MLAVRLSLVVAALLLAAGCGDDGRPELAGGARWVVVGASDAVGYGADDPGTDAWPRVLREAALPENGAVVNLAVPGTTVGEALEEQLPDALAADARLALVWLSVNDLLDGVSPDAYERQLRELVHDLRAGGRTRVLVGNTPPLDRLPAYLACRSGGRCPGAGVPPAEAVTAAVDDYNAAISRVVAVEEAELVDLHAAGMAARDAGTDASLVAGDGFHPSSAGHRMVAEAFEQVLRRE